MQEYNCKKCLFQSNQFLLFTTKTPLHALDLSLPRPIWVRVSNLSLFIGLLRSIGFGLACRVDCGSGWASGCVGQSIVANNIIIRWRFYQ